MSSDGFCLRIIYNYITVIITYQFLGYEYMLVAISIYLGYIEMATNMYQDFNLIYFTSIICVKLKYYN